MNIRQPLQSFNSIKTSQEQSYKSITEIQTFLQEIDRLQTENLKLKNQIKQLPSLTITLDNQKIHHDNLDLKYQIESLQQKLEQQQKFHHDAIKKIDINWKQDVKTFKYQLEQQDINHKQILKQEQNKYKTEVAKLQQSLTQISSAEYHNQNLVQELETELVQVKQLNNTLESKLQQTISQFDLLSKQQEVTLIKQEAICSSQEQQIIQIKQKLQIQKDQNQEFMNQLQKYKELTNSQYQSEINLNNKIKELESDIKHMTQSYQDHKIQLQSRIDELIQQIVKYTEQNCTLSKSQEKDQLLIKRLQNYLEQEQKNKQIEILDITESKITLIQFLQSELLKYKQITHDEKSNNFQLEIKIKQIQEFYQNQFRQLECKTNTLEGQFHRINSILQIKDTQIQQLENNKKLEQDKINEIIQIKSQEINQLKQQNEFMINDLSKQAENYRNLILQNKQYQSFAEKIKLNNITIYELETKCNLQDQEIQKLRQKVLDKSQLFEKVQNDNLEYQENLQFRIK